MEVARGYGVEPRLVPSAVDHHRFGLRTPSAERSPHILTLFHHAPVKGWVEARAALEHLHARRPQVAVTVFGTPPPPPDLPPWAAYRRDPPDLPDLYDAASVFLSPSRSEGFGLTGAEALASGCALVTTASGGVADYAEPGVTALTSPPGDADALGANLLRMIDDRDLRLRTAAAGRARVTDFTWERASSALESALLGASLS